MPIQAVESLRLYRQIADQLASLIDSGEYGVGDRLPPERVLAEQLKVSRSSVREALIALEVEGAIEIRGGTGVFVVDRKARRPDQPSETTPGPFELLEVRQMIEPEAASLAARHANAEDLAAMDEALEAMRSGEAYAELTGLDADRQFHTAIAQATGNGALAMVIQSLWDLRQGPLYVRLEQHFHTSRTWERAIEEHIAILDAIRAHDPRAARAAMLRHVKNAKTRFASAWSGAEPAVQAPSPPKGLTPLRRRA